MDVNGNEMNAETESDEQRRRRGGEEEEERNRNENVIFFAIRRPLLVYSYPFHVGIQSKCRMDTLTIG